MTDEAVQLTEEEHQLDHVTDQIVERATETIETTEITEIIERIGIEEEAVR